MSEDYADRKPKRKYGVDFAKPEDAPVIEVDSTKQKLKALYEQRPIFVGREYGKLHLWYAELEKLLQ